MKFFKSVTNIIFLSVIVLLVAALTFSFVVIVQKDRKIDKINAIVTESKQEIDQRTDNEARLTEELEKSRQENETLQKENGELKSEIEKLKLQKKAEAQAAIKAAAAQSPVTPGSKICYLTFDDGPSENTLKILEILERYNAKATFFVINSSKISYIKNIYEAGHAVGLHCSSHVYGNIYSSTEAYFNDLNAISLKVEEVIGIKSNIIRFPGGSSNVISKNYCNGIMTQLAAEVQQKGYRYFDWNVDSTDAACARRSPQLIINNVLNQARSKGSICVLMHDAAEKNTTVTALPSIIEGLTAQGYRFEALTPDSEIFHHGINN